MSNQHIRFDSPYSRLLLAELDKDIASKTDFVSGRLPCTYPSHAFDSCIDFLFGYTDCAIEVAALSYRPIILFVKDGTDSWSG